MGAVQPLADHRHVELTVEEANALREGLHQVELGLANLTGEVRALRELKTQDKEEIERRLREEAEKRAETDAAAKALHNRLDRYPPPEDVTSTVKEFAALRNRLAGAILAGMALGVGGGTAVGQWIAGGI